MRYVLFAVLIAVPASLVTWMLTRGGACPRPEVFVTSPKGEVARAAVPGAGTAASTAMVQVPASAGAEAASPAAPSTAKVGATPGATSATTVPAGGVPTAAPLGTVAAPTAVAAPTVAAAPATTKAAAPPPAATSTTAPAPTAAATPVAAGAPSAHPAPARDTRGAVEAAFARPVGGAVLEGGALTWYDSKGLFDYIDGGAPLYIEKGFVRLAAAELRSSTGGEISADCYDMGSPAGALAVYSSSRSSSAKPAGIGDEGQVSRMGLDFRKGRWYVKLTAFDPKSEAALPGIARDIAARLP